MEMLLCVFFQLHDPNVTADTKNQLMWWWMPTLKYCLHSSTRTSLKMTACMKMVSDVNLVGMSHSLVLWNEVGPERFIVYVFWAFLVCFFHNLEDVLFTFYDNSIFGYWTN